MPTLDLIFVTTGRHHVTEKLIQVATHSVYSHAATRFEIEGRQIIVEAVRPAVRIVEGNVFDDCLQLAVVSIPITEQQRQAIVARAFQLVGKTYGIDDCLIGGVNDLIGASAAQEINNFIDNSDTYNCSSAQTELVRAAFPWYADGIDASRITPEQARLLAESLRNTLG
ncbi:MULTISPECIES: hypothetical protein [Pelosinus]|uniref:Uncharacterized protein n=1 Tax=Pelosinus fermentans B4 TaxID=1149862 RepID=I9B452_9FIRM|nr:MULTISPECIES: hypothetical protein [Pelosinus]EIW19897.1 hypothetical protein FB4_0148 [Pelosinus fermentans B4]EIW21246.1 hypothetical protein FA11_0973 [Pelosinus fermentans A11]